MKRSLTGRLLAASTLLGMGVALVLSGGASAQNGESRAPNFSHLFPKPTGHNGYEEFVMADDLEKGSDAWQSVDRSEQEPGLETLRAVLEDDAVVRAFRLLHAGLQKPVRSPRSQPLLQTLIPELGSFRSLARLLCLKVRVSLIDGDVSGALNCLDDGLRFGRAIQVGTMMSGVIGLYIENNILRTFAKNVRDLTDDQCAELIRIVRRHVSPPDTQVALVANEQEMYIRTFAGARASAPALLDELSPGPGAAVSIRDDYSGVSKMVHEHPDQGAELMDQSVQIIRDHYVRTSDELRKPLAERNYPTPAETASPAAKLVFSLCPPTYVALSDRFGCERALAQMVGVHAAVYRYLHQHSQLPANLEGLNLGSLALDPFTGTPFEFHSLGNNAYEIRSVGGYDPGDRRHAPTGKRIPIVFTYPPASS